MTHSVLIWTPSGIIAGVSVSELVLTLTCQALLQSDVSNVVNCAGFKIRSVHVLTRKDFNHLKSHKIWDMSVYTIKSQKCHTVTIMCGVAV